MKINIEKNLKGDKLTQLFEFAESYCDRFSLERDYDGKMELDEYEAMQEELRAYFEHEDHQRRQHWKNDEDYRERLAQLMKIRTDQEAEQYFADLYEQDIEALGEAFYSEKSRPDERWEETLPDYISQRITRIGIGSIGGIYISMMFKVGDFYHQLVQDMKRLFDYPKVRKCVYMNLVMYQGDQALLTVYHELCSAELELDQTQLEQFQMLNIPYKTAE